MNMFRKISQKDIEDTEKEELEDKAQKLLDEAVSFVVDDIGQDLHKVENLTDDSYVLEEIMDVIKISAGKDDYSVFDEAVDVIKDYAKKILF